MAQADQAALISRIPYYTHRSDEVLLKVADEAAAATLERMGLAAPTLPASGWTP